MKDLITNEGSIARQIYIIRSERVMLDFDLALLYGVETRVLKQQVRRNIQRFPSDFMFQLTKEEWKELITICDKLNRYKYSPSLPFAFTEQGIAMLSGVLKGDRAIQVNIAIMRIFVHMRKLVSAYADLEKKIEKLENNYDEKFSIVFNVLKQLIQKENKPRKKIGYNFNNKK